MSAIKKEDNILLSPYMNWVFAILAFLLYVNTLGNVYVLDDVGLLVDNSLTEEGVKAWPRIFTEGYRSTLSWQDTELYRPVPKALFALYWWLAPGKPFLPHLVNVLLFAAACGLLYTVFISQFKFEAALSFVAVLLFVFHPIHTEVVANAKGQEDILALLFLLLAIQTLLRENIQVKHLLLGSAYFLLALGSKESAIVFTLLIPLGLYLFTENKKGAWQSFVFALLPASMLYLALRYMAIGFKPQEIDEGVNFLAAIQSAPERWANAIYILEVYLKQLLLPWQLLSDGSFAYFSPIAISDWRLLICLLFLVVVFVLIIRKASQKKALIFALSILFLPLIPVSNFFFLIGTNYAERFLFIPSIGFTLLLAYLILAYIKGKKNEKLQTLPQLNLNQNQAVLLILILSVFAFKTLERNSQWKNAKTLFETDVQIAPESARLQAHFANAISNAHYLQNLKSDEQKAMAIQEGIAAFEKAVNIRPNFHQAYLSLAELYAKVQRFPDAEKAFLKAISLKENNASYHNQYGNFLFAQGRMQEAEQAFFKALNADSTFANAYNNLGSIHANKGKELLQAEEVAGEVPVLRPNSLAYAEFLIASEYFIKASKYNPQLPDPFYYLSLIDQLKGNTELAQKGKAIYESMQAKTEKRNRLLKNAF